MYHLRRIRVLLAACVLASASLWAQDTKLEISSAVATSEYSGEGAANVIDGNTNTFWHSNWSSGAVFNNVSSVDLTITLSSVSLVDYVRYIPRQDRLDQGCWGEVELFYCPSTSGTDFTSLGTFQLGMTGTTYDFYLNGMEGGVQCGQIKFTIRSGGNNHATAAEIEVYAYNTEKPAAFAQYFSDDLYTQLNSDVTSSDGIADADVKALVDNMLSGADDYKKFRVGEYEAYMTTATVKSNLKLSSQYNNYENPTGIYLEKGQSCYVAVSGIGDYPVGLKIKNWYQSEAGSSYSLRNGLNYITATTEGNVFVNYYTDEFEQAPKVKVHFINAPVIGYWDQETMTNEDWVDMLADKAADDNRIIITRSEHAQLAFPVSAWKNHCPDNVDSTMTLYQQVQWAERDILGLEKYGRQVKNRQLYYATNYGFMAAGGDGAYCNVTSLGAIMNPDSRNFDLWGVGHEWGHNNQVTPGFKWSGCGETTNNIPASWAQFHFTGNRDADGNPTYLRLEDETSGIDEYAGMRGGRMQVYFEEGLRKGVAWQLQDGADYHGASLNTEEVDEYDADGNATGNKVPKNSRNYDHFVKLSPFWQLNLWGTVAGKCPDIIPMVIESIRTTEDYATTYNTNGKQQINWMKLACDVTQINLLPFFEKAGMLRPIHAYIEDYGAGWNIITEKMINELKEYVAGKGYLDFTEEINYINGHNYRTYRDNQKLVVPETLGTGCALNGNFVTVQHSDVQHAVAFETYNSSDELIRITMYGLGSDDTHSYTQVLFPEAALAEETGAYIMAVGYDGERKRIYQRYSTEDESKEGYLGRLLEDVEAIFELEDESESKVGFYKYSALTNLHTAYDKAKASYDENVAAELSAAYDLLSQEYSTLINDDYARVGIVEGNTYQLVNKLYPGYSMSIVSDSLMIGETTAESSEAQQWYFEGSGTAGRYYIKNKSTSKYPGDVSPSTQLKATATSTAGAYAYELRDMGDGLWALVGSTGLHCDAAKNIVGWTPNAEASQWYITAVTVDATAESRYELEALVQKTEELMDEVGSVSEGTEKIALTESNYYCNATYTASDNNDKFTSYDVLKDDDHATFLHTDYSSNAPDEDHYIRIDLGSGNELSLFNINYTTRGSDNVCAPTKVAIEVSNDVSEWITLCNIEDGLPTDNDKDWTIEKVGDGTPYRYIRMRVYETSTGQKANEHYFFVLSEFGISKITYAETLHTEYASIASGTLLATFKAHMAAQGVLDAAVTADYESAYNTLKTQYEALLAARDAADAAALTTLQGQLSTLITNTNSLIGECGTVTYTPATSGGEVELQTTEESEGFYLSTNASEEKEGAIEYLLDDDNSSFFHSAWSWDVAATHYLQVDMGDGYSLKEFTFSYQANKGPYPYTIEVYGSATADFASKELLGTFSKDDAENALPTSANTLWTSTNVSSETAYRYFRFEVTNSGASGINATPEGEYCFVMSKFVLTAIAQPESYDVALGDNAGGATEELMIAAHKEMASAESSLTMATTEAQLQKAIDRLQADYDALSDAKNAIQYVDFTVTVVGGNSNGGVVYEGANYTATLKAPTTLTADQLTAIALDGYVAKSVTLEGTTITVIYNKVYTVQITGGEGNGRITYAGTEYENNGTFDAEQNYFTADDLTATDVEGYNKSEVTVDNETGIISVTYTLDRTALNDLIGETANLMVECQGFTNSAFVTDELMANTGTAISTAQEQLDADLTLEEYNAAVAELQTAYDTLNTAKTNAEAEATERTQLRTALNTLITDATELVTLCGTTPGDATEALINEVSELVASAQTVAENTGSTADELTAATTALQAKYDVLNAAQQSTAKAALRTLIAQTETLVDECGVVVNGSHPIITFITLQTTDANAANYLSTNAQETSEGPIGNLLINDGSFFHSSWNATVGAAHYLQVDMGEGQSLQEFVFSYTTRDVGPHPYTIVVSGSNTNEDNSYVELATFDTGLPTAGSTSWNETGEHIISASQPYRYLRFTVTKSSDLRPYGEYCFAMSKFGLGSVSYETSYYVESLNPNGSVTEEQLLEVFNAKMDAVELANTSYDKAALEAESASLQALYDALQVAYDTKQVPVTLTTDHENPVLYTIKSKRGDTKVVQYEPASSHLFSIAEASDGSAKQAFYFMVGDERTQVYVYPYAAGQQVLAADDTGNGAAKVFVEEKTASQAKQWTFEKETIDNVDYYSLKVVGGSTYFSHFGGGSNKMGFYGAKDDGSRMTFAKTTIEGSGAYNSLKVYYDEAAKVASSEIVGGEGVGYYPVAKAEAYNTAYAAATPLVADNTSAYEAYLAAYHTLLDANEALELNMPQVGKYYTIVSACGDSRGGQLMYATGENGMKFGNDKAGEDTDVSWIRPEALWTFTEEGYMNNMQTGCYVGTSGWGAALTLVEEDDAKVVSIESLLASDGQVLLKPGNGYPLHAQSSGSMIVGYTNDNNASAWRIVEVDVENVVHTVTIGQYQHAGLYLNYPVAIPDGVQAYIIDGTDIDIDANGVGTLKLTQLTGNVLPAQTAVIVEAAAGSYNFHYTDDAATDDVESNLLTGSAYVTYREAEEGHNYYIFGVGVTEGVDAGVVGLYKNFVEYTAAGVETKEGTEDATHYRMSANKVLFDWSNSGQQVNSFRFRIDGDATGIDNIGADGNAVIYDLYGRRILEVVSSGIYIINGEKRYVHVK